VPPCEAMTPRTPLTHQGKQLQATAEGISSNGVGDVLRVSLKGAALISQTMSWYLQSMGDADTHRGELQPDGTLSAVCGIHFRPIDLPLGGVSLQGYPPDPDQICPDCAADPSRRTGLPA
jgi:hypothetical protein